MNFQVKTVTLLRDQELKIEGTSRFTLGKGLVPSDSIGAV